MTLRQFKKYFWREILPQSNYKTCSDIVDGFLSCVADVLLTDGTLILTDYFTLSVVPDNRKGRDVYRGKPIDNQQGRHRLKIKVGKGFKKAIRNLNRKVD